MARVIRTAADIQELIRAEAQTHPECAGTYFGGVYWHEPDETGCNWSISVMQSGPDSDVPACREAMVQFVGMLRSTTNLPTPK